MALRSFNKSQNESAYPIYLLGRGRVGPQSRYVTPKMRLESGALRCEMGHTLPHYHW